MGRASLLTVMAASIVLGFINLRILKTTEGSVQSMTQYYGESVARIIANEGMSYLLSQLADSSSLRQKTEKSLPTNLFTDFGPYEGNYLITDDSILVSGVQKKVIKLFLSVKYPWDTTFFKAIVYTERDFGFRPEVIRGAFTANDTINKTISDMFIDGRDHDVNGNLIAGLGVKGVSTSVKFQNVQNGAIGGTDSLGVNHAPKYPEDKIIIEENYNWGGKFPQTPDAALGFPEGKLKTIAQSRIGGSQYVSNPNNLVFPLKGITYVELPSGQKIDRYVFGGSSGILIVHNSQVNAQITNLLGGDDNLPFKGIIIADYMFHIHMDIIGANILLSSHLEKVKECQGNNNHFIRFSNEVVRQATGVAVGYGSGWQGKVPIIAWRE